MAKTRSAVLKELYRMAIKLTEKYDYDTAHKMWSLCCDWNSAHEDEEIFMCDDYDDDGVYRFFIEDDYFYYGE